MFTSRWFSNLSSWAENNNYPSGPSKIELEPQAPDFYDDPAYIANITDNNSVIAFWINTDHDWEKPFFAISHHTDTHITYSHLIPLNKLQAALTATTGASTVPTMARSFFHQRITEEITRREEYGEWSEHIFKYELSDESTEDTLSKLLDALHPLYRPGLTDWIIANHPTIATRLFTPETLSCNIHTALTPDP